MPAIVPTARQAVYLARIAYPWWSVVSLAWTVRAAVSVGRSAARSFVWCACRPPSAALRSPSVGRRPCDCSSSNGTEESAIGVGRIVHERVIGGVSGVVGPACQGGPAVRMPVTAASVAAATCLRAIERCPLSGPDSSCIERPARPRDRQDGRRAERSADVRRPGDVLLADVGRPGTAGTHRSATYEKAPPKNAASRRGWPDDQASVSLSFGCIGRVNGPRLAPKGAGLPLRRATKPSGSLDHSGRRRSLAFVGRAVGLRRAAPELSPVAGRRR
jgi:hypothetical protein